LISGGKNQQEANRFFHKLADHLMTHPKKMYDHSIELLIIYSCCENFFFFMNIPMAIFGIQFTQFFLKL
jgi:hypothetical protein